MKLIICQSSHLNDLRKYQRRVTNLYPMKSIGLEMYIFCLLFLSHVCFGTTFNGESMSHEVSGHVYILCAFIITFNFDFKTICFNIDVLNKYCIITIKFIHKSSLPIYVAVSISNLIAFNVSSNRRRDGTFPGTMATKNKLISDLDYSLTVTKSLIALFTQRRPFINARSFQIRDTCELRFHENICGIYLEIGSRVKR